MRFFYIAVMLCYVLVFPLCICYLHYTRPYLFKTWRLLVWIVLSGLFSWCFVNAAIWVPYWLGIFSPRGPELVFAMFFGWAYLWLAALPFGMLYGFFIGLKAWLNPDIDG